MKLIDAQQKLLSLKVPILETADAAACLKISITHASQILSRLTTSGAFFKLGKGKWATTQKLDPFMLPEYLVAPFPAYISLQSALYYHGMISQIPATVYAVSLARTKQYKTPLGTISLHHLNPGFFFGFDIIPKTQIKIATPEKALLDFLYLFPTRTHLFRALPELEISKKLNIKLMYNWINKIAFKSRAVLMQKKLDAILRGKK